MSDSRSAILRPMIAAAILLTVSASATPARAQGTNALLYGVPPTNRLFAFTGAPSALFDVANGARRNLGQIGNGESIRGLAISLGR